MCLVREGGKGAQDPTKCHSTFESPIIYPRKSGGRVDLWYYLPDFSLLESRQLLLAQGPILVFNLSSLAIVVVNLSGTVDLAEIS